MPINNKLDKPKVTLFIPAYNEEKLLGKTLARIRNQDYPGEFELLVIDNASTDRTAAIAKEYGARVITEETKGNRFAVERGFKEARGEIVVQTDADTRPTKSFLSAILKPYEDPEVIAVGTRVKFFGCSPLINILINLAALVNPRESMWGLSLSARKSAWEKVGGFNKGFDLNADAYFTLALRKIGKVVIVKNYYMLASGRRYAGNLFDIFINTFQLNINSLFMVFTGKPIFRRPFKDIR